MTNVYDSRSPVKLSWLQMSWCISGYVFVYGPADATASSAAFVVFHPSRGQPYGCRQVSQQFKQGRTPQFHSWSHSSLAAEGGIWFSSVHGNMVAHQGFMGRLNFSKVSGIDKAWLLLIPASRSPPVTLHSSIML